MPCGSDLGTCSGFILSMQEANEVLGCVPAAVSAFVRRIWSTSLSWAAAYLRSVSSCPGSPVLSPCVTQIFYQTAYQQVLQFREIRGRSHASHASHSGNNRENSIAL